MKYLVKPVWHIFMTVAARHFYRWDMIYPAWQMGSGRWEPMLAITINKTANVSSGNPTSQSFTPVKAFDPHSHLLIVN